MQKHENEGEPNPQPKPKPDIFTNPTIPEIFETRKSQIIQDLSVPETEYTDLSPKGSIDQGIRDLIHNINALPGLVTTSSCAGRISIFLEGRGKGRDQKQRQFVPSGGKGAGKWLYVSHEPVNIQDSNSFQFHELFGLVPSSDSGSGGIRDKFNKHGDAPRLVRFHFEPMVCIEYLITSYTYK